MFNIKNKIMTGDLLKRESGLWVVIYSKPGSGVIKESRVSNDDSFMQSVYGNKKFIPDVSFRLENDLAVLEISDRSSNKIRQKPTPLSESTTMGNTKNPSSFIDAFVGRAADAPKPFNPQRLFCEEQSFSDSKEPFTINENSVMRHLVSSYEEFSKLKQTHPDDLRDFVFHIHALQRILGQRVLRRKYPETFPTHER